MSKYENLWIFVSESRKEELLLTFDEIEKICNEKLDHSFLTYKSALLTYGYQVKKISMKQKTVLFAKYEKV